MERRLICPLMAKPNRIACSTALAFATGSVPGSAMSTAEAWVFGGAPKAVEAPENILLCVASWACVSIPTTISQPVTSAPFFPSRSFRLLAQQLAATAPVDDQRLEVGLRAALRRAVLRRDAHELARLAQRHAAAAGSEAQAAFERLLLQAGHHATMSARRHPRAPLQVCQFSALDRISQARGITLIASVAAHACAIAVQRREFLAQLEALALLPAGAVARALEHAALPGAAQLAAGGPAVEDRGIAFLQRRDAELGASFALDKTARKRGKKHVLARELPAAVRTLRSVHHHQRAAASHLTDELAGFIRFLTRYAAGGNEKKKHQVSHNGVSFGTRRCQSLAC